MDIEKYAENSLLPRKVLRWMVKKEFIRSPLDEGDISGLQLLEKTWGKCEVIRAQLTRLSKARRLQLLTSPDFETKWERYAYSRFSNLPRGKRLSMKQLANEIEMTFGFLLDHRHIRRLYKVREKVYYKRKILGKNDRSKCEISVKRADK